MDGWTDGQGETSIPPFNFIEAGGINIWTYIGSVCMGDLCNDILRIITKSFMLKINWYKFQWILSMVSQY